MLNRCDPQFNPSVIKDLQKINEKLEEANEKEERNPDEINKLKMAKLLRGMELQGGYGNFYNRGIPY